MKYSPRPDGDSRQGERESGNRGSPDLTAIGRRQCFELPIYRRGCTRRRRSVACDRRVSRARRVLSRMSRASSRGVPCGDAKSRSISRRPTALTLAAAFALLFSLGAPEAYAIDAVTCSVSWGHVSDRHPKNLEQSDCNHHLRAHAKDVQCRSPICRGRSLPVHLQRSGTRRRSTATPNCKIRRCSRNRLTAVRCRLLADTEVPEDDVEQLVDPHRAGDAAQRAHGEPQVLGG